MQTPAVNTQSADSTRGELLAPEARWMIRILQKFARQRRQPVN